MELARTILKKIIDDPQARRKVFNSLNQNHFREKIHKLLYRIISSFKTRGIITFDMIVDFVSKKGIRKEIAAKLTQEMGVIASMRSILNSEFGYAFKELAREAQSDYIYERVQEVLNHLGRDDVEKATQLIKEIPDETTKLAHESANIVSARTMGKLKPDSVISRYKTGFKVIDDITGGARDGELFLVAAYTGEFKSTILLSMAHTNFVEGKKILFASFEMGVDELKRRLICQHGMYLNKPLNFRNVEFGNMSNEEKKNYSFAINDFDNNDKYGEIKLFVVPSNYNIMDVFRDYEALSSKIDIDILVLDYIQKLAPIRIRGHFREELNDTLATSKRLAMEARANRGIWLVSGYQTSTDGRKQAEKQGYYDLWALSETIGAGQNANVVIWSLQTELLRKDKEVKMGIAKSRNSSIRNSMHYLVIDPEVGLISKEPIDKELDDNVGDDLPDIVGINEEDN